MNSEHLYSIKEFATMAALPQSAVRFYQKNGVIKPIQQANGYFMYTKHDAFRINAFKMLLSYGFSVVEAVNLLDTNYENSSFIESLKFKKNMLKKELVQIQERIEIISRAEKMLQGDFEKFEIVTVPNSYVAKVSEQDNFLVAKSCKDEVAAMAECLGLTHYVRILSSESLKTDDEYWKPSYGMCVCESDLAKVFSGDVKNLVKIDGGKAIKYTRRINRKNSEKRSSYQELFDYMNENKLNFRGEVILYPHFFKLDSECNDFETIYVFLKNKI